MAKRYVKVAQGWKPLPLGHQQVRLQTLWIEPRNFHLEDQQGTTRIAYAAPWGPALIISQDSTHADKETELK